MHPSDVAVVFVNDLAKLDSLCETISTSISLAIDTETYGWEKEFTGYMRVMSLAVRLPSDEVLSFVVDARDVDVSRLSSCLKGREAYAWNASFDSRVLDAAVFDEMNQMQWWDGMFADALLYQGRSGFSWFHGLAWAAKHYLDYELDGKGTTQTSYTASDALSDEQIRYAAHDAITTLWTCEKLSEHIHDAGLDQALKLELEARPFLDDMERNGIPVDWTGWETYLDQIKVESASTLNRLAILTGGGQSNLFDANIAPSWNPKSTNAARQQLNKFSKDEVRAYFKATSKKARLFRKTDTLDADTLKEIGGDLALTLLEHRHSTKVLTTYGDTLAKYVDEDSRIRPKYAQIVGTGTGRLSSRSPNAQNFTPLLKPYMHPLTEGRVFVYADLSQAELRFLAQLSGDINLRNAFLSGEDVHVATAELMARVDMTALKDSDPESYKRHRREAKVFNFGTVYGQGPGALARSLTLQGSPTTLLEAKGLLGQYYSAYPQVKEWLDARDAEVGEIVYNLPLVDWDTTLELVKDKLDKADRFPEIPGAVVWCLDQQPAPFEFSSRTASGRLRHFNVSADSYMFSLAMMLAESQDLTVYKAVLDFGHKISLEPSTKLKKLFEDRELRGNFITHVHKALWDSQWQSYLQRVLAERVRMLSNAYRNAPIQGGVAEVILAAYGKLAKLTPTFTNVQPVQTVHDSIVLECNTDDAPELARCLKEIMEESFTEFCPDVPAVADADIRRSLDDTSVITII